MHNANDDFLTAVIIKFIEISNFNTILELVNHKFNYLYKTIKSKEEKKWVKYNLYYKYINPIKGEWKLFKKTWDFNYKEGETYNKDIVLNNYCQFYILKNIVNTNLKLLNEYYNGYPNISKKNRKILNEISNDINLELENKDFTNYTLITPQFNNNLFNIEENKKSNKYLAFLIGPPKTVYENGIFILELEIFNDLFKKTKVKFLNKIYHPNVDFNTGILNIDILNESWQPIYGGNPRILILSVYSILIEPEISNYNPRTNSNQNIIKEFNEDKLIFKEKVKKNITENGLFNINKLMNILYSN